ncbi:MAG TPA: MFS transporter [bacterium]|nr:MFS transporter [bacterium]
MARLRRLAIDLSPFRESRLFRLLWWGQLVSGVGSDITRIALPYQVYRLTGSTLAVGLLALCQLIPLLTASLAGGAIADAYERRRLLMWLHAGLSACSVALAANAHLSTQRLWVLYALTACITAFDALTSPALGTLVPRFFPLDRLPAALALNGLARSFGALVGPVLGGVLIARIGLTGAYLADAATFLVALATLGALAPVPPHSSSPPAGLESIREGLRFLKGRKVLQSTFTIDLNAMIFGMPTSLFPAVARRLGGGSEVLGLLYAAPHAGAFVATLLSGGVGRVRRQGRAVMIAVVLWGAAVTAFGIARTLWPMLIFLAAAGAADLTSAIFRDAIAQSVTPDALRGRLNGMELAVVASGPALGDLEAGIVGSLTSVPFSIISGGIACILGVGVLAKLVPEFSRYDAAHPTP